MKKLLASILAMTLAFSLTACAQEKNEVTPDSTTTNATQSTVATTEKQFTTTMTGPTASMTNDTTDMEDELTIESVSEMNSTSELPKVTTSSSETQVSINEPTTTTVMATTKQPVNTTMPNKPTVVTTKSTEKTSKVTCNHVWKAATCVSPKTCSVCGATEGNLGAHSYKKTESLAPTCTTAGIAKYVCTYCNHTYTDAVNALGHDWENATCVKDQTCKRCGVVGEKALGHADVGNGKCSRCGEVMKIDMTTIISAPKDCEFYRNSVDGLKLWWRAINNSGKTINYYTVTLYFENPVGDPAYDEITGNTYQKVNYVGPIKPGAEMGIYQDVGYSRLCEKIIIGDIKLEYSDGTVDYGWYGYRASEV